MNEYLTGDGLRLDLFGLMISIAHSFSGSGQIMYSSREELGHPDESIRVHTLGRVPSLIP